MADMACLPDSGRSRWFLRTGSGELCTDSAIPLHRTSEREPIIDTIFSEKSNLK
jgi:hypothetical protein